MTAALRVEAAPPSQEGGDRLLDLITGLFLLGPAVAHDDADFHRRHIAWEWKSGQWVMLTDERDRLLGWLSWYCVQAEALALLRELNLDALEQLGDADLALTVGPHLYFATLLVAPWAPSDTLMRLIRLACARNPDVASISWHDRGPGGRSRFMHRPANHQEIGLCP